MKLRFAALCFSLLVIPTMTQSQSLDNLIDVGGYRLHIRCEGQAAKGRPTVILDSGGGNSMSSWRLVQPEIAKFARVCSYDRPGLGRSERKLQPYTSSDVMKDLHTLLTRAKVAQPYVLAGHSIGGMNVRVFAKLYPKEVSGLVFVDSINEEEHPRTRAIIPAEVLKKIPPEHLKPMVQEDLDLETSIQQALKNKWQNDVPLIVLTRAPSKSSPAETPPGGHELFPGATDKFEKLRIELQNELAKRSTNSKHIIAEKSGHNIQLDQPELVIESIRQIVVAAGKKDRKLSQ